MTTESVAIPEKLIPVFMGKADVRGSYGGRGSAKTRSFAKMAALKAYQWSKAGKKGIILVTRQHLNSIDDSSLEEIKMAIESEEWLKPFFDVGDRYIRTADGNIDFTFSGLDRNISSIKSKSHILLCWVDEAEPVTEKAWITLIPTIREEGSELWVTWNPEREGSPVDNRFRKIQDPLYKIEEMNWRDNKKFPAKLQREKARDEENRPEQVDHIWDGGYKTIVEGAYFTQHLHKANKDGRICNIGEDPLMTIRLFADIGGTGAKADNFVFWADQFIGKERRSINHYEVQGQPIGSHLLWLHQNEYIPGRAKIYLPHDGETNDRVFDISYESAFSKAGYDVEVIPNQGKGAAMLRVESCRNTFTNSWFDTEKTKAGRKALGWYHEKIDENRQIGLGPDHDWSSHSADAYGLGSIVYEKEQQQKPNIKDPYAGFRRNYG